MCVWVAVLHTCLDSGFEYRRGQGCSILVFVECCVGNGLYDELITCSEESYRERVCVFVYVYLNVRDIETSTMRQPSSELTCNATKCI
jgi:hypothetical protein